MMNLLELIEEGNSIKEYKGKRNSNSFRERYVTWKTACFIFLNNTKADIVIRNNFIIAAANFELSWNAGTT